MNTALQVVEKAVEDAEEYQAHLEHNKESLKLMKIVERFLRDRKRLLYGGFAINALLPEKDKFYDPKKELPDFDFLTPDPYTDVAELMQRFMAAGYTEVEPTIGIHDGTYKVFVNFQGVADITYCDPIVYATLQKEASSVEGLHVCPPNYLRMNMFVELSHPGGDVSRWTKVYKRFLLLNKTHPFHECKQVPTSSSPLSPVFSSFLKSKLYSHFIRTAQLTGDVLLGIPDIPAIFARQKMQTLKKQVGRKGPFLLVTLSNSPLESAKAIIKSWDGLLNNLTIREVNAVGELLPSRVEVVYDDIPLYIAFQTVACHAYYDVPIRHSSVRVGSLDTLLNFYFAFYYANMEYPGHPAILCLCKELLELLYAVRVQQNKPWPFPAFAVQCLGYQATFAELKREHRERVKVEREKKKSELKLRRSIKAASDRLSVKKTRTRRTKRGLNTA